MFNENNAFRFKGTISNEKTNKQLSVTVGDAEIGGAALGAFMYFLKCKPNERTAGGFAVAATLGASSGWAIKRFFQEKKKADQGKKVN